MGKVKKYVEDETFLLTYGDGLSNVNIEKLIKAHNKSNKLVTVTAVQPPGRFGRLKINDLNLVSGFNEKPQGDGDWINGGFFIVSPQALTYAGGDDISWESKPMDNLVRNKQLNAYKHDDFWHPMDTLRDKEYLNSLWETGKAPWRLWT